MIGRGLHIRGIMAVLGLLLGVVAPGWAQPQEQAAIGIVTTVRGAVSVEHRGSAAPVKLAVRQPLRAHDVVGTGARAKVKALLHDDTMLALGPQSRMTIDEYLHAPELQVRRMTVQLERGLLRTLVGRAFAGLGSTFVIRAGAASVIANAAYCIVWRHEQETGVVNIGSAGAVSFMAEGRVVILEPGFYSIAPAGKPPGAAEPMSAQAPPAVREAIGETEIGDDLGSAVNELAEQEIEEELRACPPGSPPGGICPRKSPPAALSPATPPAVTSGAKRR
jgi:hypothetical protein